MYRCSHAKHIKCIIDPRSNFKLLNLRAKLLHSRAKHLKRIIDPSVFLYPSSYHDPHCCSKFHCVTRVNFKLLHSHAQHITRIIDSCSNFKPSVFLYPGSHYCAIWH